MKKPCSSVFPLLEKYFDQEATEEEKALVEGHVEACQDCRSALASLGRLRNLVEVPSAAHARPGDFDRVWLEIQRKTRPEERLSVWETVRSWFDLSLLLRKRVWIPAVAVAAIVIVLMVPSAFKNSSSLPGQFGVEYVESDTNNVMVYEIETAKVTVIWLLEGPETEPAT